MNYSSKQLLIAHFLDLLRQGDFVKIYDQETVEEFKTFCWTGVVSQSGAGAERGFHDDNVISTMLGYLELAGKPKPNPGNLINKRLEEMRGRQGQRGRFQSQSDI